MVAFDSLMLLLEPSTMLVIIGCAIYGLVVGAIPGFTATMAVALLVPMTYFLDPVPALAGIVTLAAMAIFAGDIPGALLRMPGTPASAAYADESFQMARRGEAETALGTSLVASALGGIFGALLLIFAAPALAEISLSFSSFEYFWLACLGLVAAIAASNATPAKGAISLFIGLTIGMVGLDPVFGQQRFTFGNVNLVGGLAFIPVLIGLFAVSEAFRFGASPVARPEMLPLKPAAMFKGVFGHIGRLKLPILRGGIIGSVVGAIPGAGADIAAYISYAVARRLSPNKDKFGTGTVDGIVPATAANNAAVGGALIPATVFGIPGDSLTAVIIGVLYMKGLNPGPTVFLMQPTLLYAVFIAFLIANIVLVPFGFGAIVMFRRILSAPPGVVMALVIMACIVGAFAVENTTFAIAVMLGAGLLGYYLEENEFPLAPVILGIVLGPILESTFLASLAKSQGAFTEFFSRPIAGTLGATTIALVIAPLVYVLIKSRRQAT
ncbi:tripartite tricarboxylate transporter permease [Marinovum sp. 2_MG-2023]|uniref:tripartite tricarboxylate transporter permease n=1 Tax=unclassified Marinovum TaxID=2647166 RepID=UPI0026E47D3C|nr:MULTISPECIES: tripartite tricarboxylate transporter permease [unclassified Marinovum]MDO6730784.1 tripartite tricarboxylate transporter permease [Marinovum sp. 2_MG-2023]MDO6780011.1 tripartite tricarboxylate transporter permease [Marinovum sp. 1_MG-2023]